MKAILPILICSAIAAGLGYYFGHITLPVDSEAGAKVASTPESPFQPQPTPPPAPVAPVAVAPNPNPTATPPVATNPAPVAEPTASKSEFAARATNTMQTLTDNQGRSIEVSILEVSNTEVKARRSDGRQVIIPLNMLSAEDVAFCNYLKEQADSKPAAQPSNTGDFDWDAYFNS